MKRSLPLLVFFLAVSCVFLQHAPLTENLSVVRYNAIPEYQVWAQAALDCSRVLKQRNPALPFEIVHDSVDVNNFVWLAVATEVPGGGFPCRSKVGSCYGISGGDTIMVSSWHVAHSWVIKHELMQDRKSVV